MRRTVRRSVHVGVAIAIAATLLASGASTATATASAAGTRPVADAPQFPNGYYLLGGDGGIFPFAMPMSGSAASDPTRCAPDIIERTEPNGTCFSMAVTPSGLGYWILNADTGAVYPFGTAGFYGDPEAQFAGIGREFVPTMLQIVSTPDGKGYWIYEIGLAGLGTVEGFGDAGFFGDTAMLSHSGHSPAFGGEPVGMAATADGKGYWEVRSDGGVFSFGDAKFYGAFAGSHLTKPIIGITATADGKGYWLYAADGGVFAFGDAKYGGSLGGLVLNQPIVGMARNPVGPGYWLAAADGGVFTFGGAPFMDSLPKLGITPARPIFAIAARGTAPPV